MTGLIHSVGRVFGGLEVRYKLMVLHNLFFVFLALSVWFALIPLLERYQGTPPPGGYAEMVRQVKLTLVVVLGFVYCLAVLIMELSLLPAYIYGPLRRMLEADEASRRGDTARELIDEALIQGDELGRLIASRNQTVRQLRKLAQDLARKNELLETAKRNLADQDRLVSLGLLSASVAHELNSPLAVLRGSIEQLIEAGDDPPARERLDRMLRVTQRLQRMSEALLDFSRVRSFKTEPVAVRALIDESWSLVAIDEKAACVHFQNQTGEECVLGNFDRLVQLFVNLLRNALHAVHAGGHIRVSSRLESDPARTRLAVIAVDDDGPGIPAGILPDVFEAFVTTRLDARGTGLGLTVAEGIAHQHGGAISAANRPEGGARLEVRLPAAIPPREGPP